MSIVPIKSSYWACSASHIGDSGAIMKKRTLVIAGNVDRTRNTRHGGKIVWVVGRTTLRGF